MVIAKLPFSALNHADYKHVDHIQHLKHIYITLNRTDENCHSFRETNVYVSVYVDSGIVVWIRVPFKTERKKPPSRRIGLFPLGQN